MKLTPTSSPVPVRRGADGAPREALTGRAPRGAQTGLALRRVLARCAPRDPRDGIACRRRRVAGIALAALLPIAATPLPSIGQGDGDRGAAPFVVRVFDDGGRPVDGARVSIWSVDHERRAGDRTGPRGRVTFAELPPPPFTVLVTADGFRSATREVDESAGGAATVRLDRGRTVTLRVRDAATGEPVSSFRVAVLPADRDPGGDAESAFVMAGVVRAELLAVDGAAALRGLPEEPVVLLVTAPGYPPTPHGPLEPGDAEIEIPLEERGCVRHALIDAETGEPLEGVRAIPDLPMRQDVGEDAMLEIARSDAEGLLTLCAMERGPARVVLHEPAYAPLAVELPSAGGSVRSGRVLELGRGGSVVARIAFSDGSPVPDATVIVRAGGLERRATTDETGTARLERIPADDAARLVVLIDEDAAPAGETSLSVVHGRRRIVPLDLDTRVTIRTTFEGDPVTGAGALLLRRDGVTLGILASSETDLAGAAAFHVAETIPEDALLVLRDEDTGLVALWSEALPGENAPGERSISLPGRLLEGRVSDATTADEIAGAIVTCTRRGADSNLPVWGTLDGGTDALRYERAGRDLALLRPGSFAVTDARGRFAMRLPGDCGRITVTGPEVPDDEAPWHLAQVKWWDLDDDATVDVTLARRARLRARLRGPAGARLSVTLRDAKQPGRVRVLRPALSDGTILFDPTDEGPWMIVARGDGWVGVAGPVATPPGSVSETDVRIEEGGFLLVRPENGGVGSLAVIDERGLDWSVLGAVHSEPGPEGGVRVGPLPSGEYTVIAGGREESLRIAYPGDVREAF